MPARYDLSTPGQPGQARGRRRAGALAEEAGLSLIHLALAFMLQHPAVTAPIIGPRTHGPPRVAARGGRRDAVRDVLDRIDEIVPPGVTLSRSDAGYVAPALRTRGCGVDARTDRGESPCGQGSFALRRPGRHLGVRGDHGDAAALRSGGARARRWRPTGRCCTGSTRCRCGWGRCCRGRSGSTAGRRRDAGGGGVRVRRARDADGDRLRGRGPADARRARPAAPAPAAVGRAPRRDAAGCGRPARSPRWCMRPG